MIDNSLGLTGVGGIFTFINEWNSEPHDIELPAECEEWSPKLVKVQMKSCSKSPCK